MDDIPHATIHLPPQGCILEFLVSLFCHHKQSVVNEVNREGLVQLFYMNDHDQQRELDI